MRSLGLVATQTLTFLFTDIEGSAAMGHRLGDAYAEVLAGLEVRRAARIAAVAHGG
jgi:class 3 adenylate cyclase